MIPHGQRLACQGCRSRSFTANRPRRSTHPARLNEAHKSLTIEQLRNSATTQTGLLRAHVMEAHSDLDRLPPQVRRVAQKSGPIIARFAHRIAQLPPTKRRAAFGEADATFRQTAEANGLMGLMVERYTRCMRHALNDAVSKIDGRAGPSGVA
jgi:hypothetical protein